MIYRFVVIVISIALLITLRPALAQTNVMTRLEMGQPPIIIAHRSASIGGQPENSLGWIAEAIDHGVEMVHINPQETSDGHYVLMHDPTLNRMTDVESVFPDGPPDGPTRPERGGKDYVGDYTRHEIRHLHLVEDLHGNAQPVPTLDEALDLVDGKALILLGLKSFEIDSMARALKDRNTNNVLFFELFYSGTDQSKLRELVDATGVPTAVALFRTRNALGDLTQISEQLGSRLKMVMTDSKRVTPDFIALVNELDLRVAISGWDGLEDHALVQGNDPTPWRSIIEKGHSVMTDHPLLLLDVMGEK